MFFDRNRLSHPPARGCERYLLVRLVAPSLAKSNGIQEEAHQLVKFAHMTRNLKGQALDEGASTRLLVHAAKLMVAGVAPIIACRSSIAQALTDDRDMLSAVNELGASHF